MNYPAGIIAPPTFEFVLFFWLFTTSYAFAAYGRKRIEENHPRVFEELGSPEGIGVNLAEKEGRKYYRYFFGFKFLKLNDPQVNLGYIGSFILSGIALIIIWT